MPLGKYKKFNGERWRLHCVCGTETQAKQLADEIRSGKHHTPFIRKPRVRRDKTVIYIIPTGGWK
jgi:hypothetical protein